ncbi:MAG: sulfite exporter TauE/SafE family protein [Myxococcota bacterium]
MDGHGDLGGGDALVFGHATARFSREPGRPPIEFDLGVLALIVVGAMMVQTAIGFGAMLICVTFGSMLFTVPELTAMLVPLSMLQTTYIVVHHWRDVNVRLLFTRILPWMGLGMSISFLWVGGEAQPWMRPTLGVMVLLLALRELGRAWFGATKGSGGSRVAATLGLIVAGSVHAVFATGGPPLVWALGQEGLDKATFRTTLTAVWVGVNTVLVTAFAFRGQLTSASLTATAMLVVPLIIGIVIGEWLHTRVQEDGFRVGVWGFLAVAAIPLIMSGVVA